MRKAMKGSRGRKDKSTSFMHGMHHYVSLTPDGLYHVQNMAGTLIGQHHVHSEEGFGKWKKPIDKKYIHTEKAEFCACGLGAGSVKEYDGRIWFNDKYK
jgi:hypothetical protein